MAEAVITIRDSEDGMIDLRADFDPSLAEDGEESAAQGLAVMLLLFANQALAAGDETDPVI